MRASPCRPSGRISARSRNWHGRTRLPSRSRSRSYSCFFFQAADGIRDWSVTGVQTCALPILSCHDPHRQPTEQQAPAYFRQKCMSCHTESSCRVPLSVRQQKSPPDNCIGCHMPKRNVNVISHSVLTNHRIIADPNEPFPDVAFHMVTPELPDLVHLNASPGKMTVPAPLTLLEAYRQVMTAHPGYRERYWSLAKQLEAGEPENVAVLEALADLALQNKSREGLEGGIRYLDLARNRGSTNPADFELLGRLFVARGAPAQIAGYQHSAADPLEFQYLKFRCLMLNFEAFCYTSPFGLLGIPVELCGVPNVLRRI